MSAPRDGEALLARLRQQPAPVVPGKDKDVGQWRRNGAGAQILSDLGLGKLRVLGTRAARLAWPVTAWKWWRRSPCNGDCRPAADYRWVPAVGRQPLRPASHGRGPSTLELPLIEFPKPHMSHYEGDLRTPESARFAILASRWNARITDTLVAGARQSLAGNGITEANIDVIRVPGAWELPLVAARLAAAHEHAAILTLGCVIRGDTRHYEHVADRCAEGLMRVQLDFGVPVLNGVLAVERVEDAEARAGGSHGNKGEEVALAALEMVNLLEQLP